MACDRTATLLHHFLLSCSADASDMAKVAGPVVGSSLGLLIVLLIIWLVRWKKEKKKYEEEETPNEIRYVCICAFLCLCRAVMRLKYAISAFIMRKILPRSMCGSQVLQQREYIILVNS